MTAVDVHGGTVNEPIFAETVSAFNLVLADGTSLKIDRQLQAADGWHPLQFARVSLGGLGIVTSMTIDVLPRPYASTLYGDSERYGVENEQAFVAQFQPLLANHARLETFFTPYATDSVGFPLYTKNFLVLWWDIVDHPATKTLNGPPAPYPPSACALAAQAEPQYGAPNLGSVAEGLSQPLACNAQYAVSPGNTVEGAIQDGLANPAIISAAAFDVIESQVGRANASHSELWLAQAARVIFMSYYVPLPNLGVEGLRKVWTGLDVVSRIVTQDRMFHIAAPMEFRFVKGGDSAMSGAYSPEPSTWFVNLDLIGFVDAGQTASQYPAQLLKFFADVERAWVAMGGFPHNGKIYGFYDPAEGPGTWSKSGPFNAGFLADLGARRGARLEAFKAYRERLDPKGLFFNDFLGRLLAG